MSKAFGKRNKQLHGRCRRCGNNAFHLKKKVCASCGFGESKKRRNPAWAD